MDWSHLVYEVPSEIRYCRKDKREGQKGDDEEEDVSSYWMTLMKRQNILYRKRKH
jgi:hypothetical protein